MSDHYGYASDYRVKFDKAVAAYKAHIANFAHRRLAG